MKTEINPGKWRMRNGEYAVVEFRTQSSARAPWIGYDIQNKGLMSWYENGAYNAHGESLYDLIEPWTDKPVVNWAAMPAWARWVAMERDRNWFWYNHKPSIDKFGHVLNTGWFGPIPPEFFPSFTGNWRDSLVERPKE